MPININLSIMNKLLILSAATLLAVSCGTSGKKHLVAYFSATGRTASLAQKMADIAGADIYQITPEQEYTRDDLNWSNGESRSSREMNDPEARPAIKGKIRHINRYDTLYVGFPIWWYTAPRIIDTFFEENDLKGKPVKLFATSGGTGIARAAKELAAKYPDVNFIGSKLFHGESEEEIKNFFLPEGRTLCGGYTEQREIYDEEMEMFRSVVKDSVLVITPLSVGTQVVAGMNYKFHCRYSDTSNGKAGLCEVVIYKNLQGVATLTKVEKE